MNRTSVRMDNLLLVAVSLVAALAGGYVVSYFLLLDPVEIVGTVPDGRPKVIYRRVRYNARGWHVLGGRFFKPIHRVDQFLRADYWELTPVPEA